VRSYRLVRRWPSLRLSDRAIRFETVLERSELSGQRAVPEHVCNPPREVAASDVPGQQSWRSVLQFEDELPERTHPTLSVAVPVEHQRPTGADGYVDVLLSMPHVSGEARGNPEGSSSPAASSVIGSATACPTFTRPTMAHWVSSIAQPAQRARRASISAECPEEKHTRRACERPLAPAPTRRR